MKIKQVFFYIFLLFFGLNISCQNTTRSTSQILRTNYCSPPSSFHPHLVSDIRTHTLCKALFEGLTRINPEGEVELAAAEKVEISSCKTRYTFALRPSKWSNEKPLTSHHFANSWKKALTPSSKSIHVKRLFLLKNANEIYKGNLPAKTLGVYTPSETQLVIELEHPAPYFLQLLADPLYSPLYDDNDDNPTVFNGPFLLKDYKINTHINLSANPHYWDAKTVSLKKIHITIVKDFQTALYMYEKGQLDLLGGPFTNLSKEALETLSNIKIKETTDPFWIFCNTQNPKLKSKEIRKALACAIDRTEIIKYTLPHQKEIYTILPKNLSSPYSESESPFKYNLKIAQELFELGLKKSNLKKDHFQLILSHSDIPEQERLATYLKHQWEKAFGIRVFLKKDDWKTFHAKICSRDFEIGGFYLSNLYDDPFYFMESFEYSYSNYSQWENPTYQKYLQIAKQCKDIARRNHYLKKAESILIQSTPVLPVCIRTHLFVSKDSLKNFSAPHFTYADFKWTYFED